MKLLSLILVVALTGCAGIKEMIPSFQDPLQSEKIVSVRLASEKFDCNQPHLPQALKIQDDLRWFELYSKGKGWRQNDVLKLIAPMQETVNDFVKRSRESQGTVMYCEIKKKVMITQSSRAAEVVLGRF
jgi:hypothetical protein